MAWISKERGLIVRHHERQPIELPGEFEIAPSHAVQVHFSATSDGLGPHCIGCTAADLSAGGLGVRTRLFVPRMTEGTVRLFHREGAGSDSDSLVLEEPVKVRRVEMIGREPRYILGLSFSNPDAPERSQRIHALLERFSDMHPRWEDDRA